LFQGIYFIIYWRGLRAKAMTMTNIIYIGMYEVEYYLALGSLSAF